MGNDFWRIVFYCPSKNRRNQEITKKCHLQPSSSVPLPLRTLSSIPNPSSAPSNPPSPLQTFESVGEFNFLCDAWKSCAVERRRRSRRDRTRLRDDVTPILFLDAPPKTQGGLSHACHISCKGHYSSSTTQPFSTTLFLLLALPVPPPSSQLLPSTPPNHRHPPTK